MIFNVSETNCHIVEHLLPDDLIPLLKSNECLCLFNTDETGVAVSVLVAGVNSNKVLLHWLFTVPDNREKGYAKALLVRLNEIVQKVSGLSYIAISLPSENPSIGFFLKNGFIMPEEPDMEYITTVKAMRSSALLTKEYPALGVIPLLQVKPAQMSSFLSEVQSNDNPLSIPDSYTEESCISELSFACVEDEKMTGMILFEQAGNNVIDLSVLQVINSPTAAMKLLYSAGKRLLSNYPDDICIHITTVNEASRKLAGKLMTLAKKKFIFRLTLPIRRV